MSWIQDLASLIRPRRVDVNKTPKQLRPLVKYFWNPLVMIFEPFFVLLEYMLGFVDSLYRMTLLTFWRVVWMMTGKPAGKVAGRVRRAVRRRRKR